MSEFKFRGHSVQATLAPEPAPGQRFATKRDQRNSSRVAGESCWRRPMSWHSSGALRPPVFGGPAQAIRGAESAPTVRGCLHDRVIQNCSQLTTHVGSGRPDELEIVPTTMQCASDCRDRGKAARR